MSEHHRTPIVLPLLPPEIWLSIFRFATWSTGIFNPQLMVFTKCDTSYQEQLGEFKDSLVTKKYLVRVCKAWYYLASQFLFEYVFLGKSGVLAPLRDGMLRSECDVENQDLPHSIGWWIQRIDVHMKDRPDNPRLIFNVLTDILKRLPNLRILTFAITGYLHNPSIDSYYLPKNVLQATSVCRDTLQFLNWYGGLGPSPNSWSSFLDNHPRLEAINVPANRDFGNSHIALNYSLKSVYVHCRTVPDPALHVKNGLVFPNVRHAIYDISDLLSEFISHDDFLQKIGPNLTSIQVNHLKPIPSGFDNAFRRIVVACKKVTRVDIVTYEWLIPTIFIPLEMEMVQTLGIRVTLHQVPKRSVVTFLRTLQEFSSGFPSLRTICFMDQGNIRALRAYPQAFSPYLDRIVKLGISVVDQESHSLI